MLSADRISSAPDGFSSAVAAPGAQPSALAVAPCGPPDRGSDRALFVALTLLTVPLAFFIVGLDC